MSRASSKKTQVSQAEKDAGGSSAEMLVPRIKETPSKAEETATLHRLCVDDDVDAQDGQTSGKT
jgi:hypothetical protein